MSNKRSCMVGEHRGNITIFSTSNSVHSAKMVGRPKTAAKTKKENLARAQQIRVEARKAPPELSSSNTNAAENGEADDESSGDDIECTGWNGSVVHYVSSDDEPIVISDDDTEGEEEVEELSGSELEEVLQRCLETPEAILQSNAETNRYSTIMRKRTEKDWKKAESCRSLGYNGQSARTKRHHEQLVRGKEKEDAKLRNR